MEAVRAFLVGQPLFLLMFCLGMGYLLNKTRIFKPVFNTTIWSLLIAVCVNLLLQHFSALSPDRQWKLELPSALRTAFYALFSFSLGYRSGPEFRLNKASLKSLVIALAYALTGLTTAVVCCRLLNQTGKETVQGIMAGALTQSSILSVGSTSGDTVSYAICYVAGTLIVICFVQIIAPWLLNRGKKTKKPAKLTQLNWALKDTLRLHRPDQNSDEDLIPVGRIQLRAYRMKACGLCGQTVQQIEDEGSEAFEVVAIYRNGQKLEGTLENVPVAENDVLVVVGDVEAVYRVLDWQLEEVPDNHLLWESLRQAEIVLTSDQAFGKKVLQYLDECGVLVRLIERNGKRYRPEAAGDARIGDVLQVLGIDSLVRKTIEDGHIGYFKSTGPDSDIPWMLLAIALSILLGSLPFLDTLGASCLSMILGLLAGRAHSKRPGFCYIHPAAVSFMSSLGLNLFITSLTLTSELTIAALSPQRLLPLLVCCCFTALVPLLVSLAAGKSMRMDPVDLLGAICGGATNTASLNSLRESSGNDSFVLGYTPAYVAGNLLLTFLAAVAVGMV